MTYEVSRPLMTSVSQLANCAPAVRICSGLSPSVSRLDRSSQTTISNAGCCLVRESTGLALPLANTGSLGPRIASPAFVLPQALPPTAFAWPPPRASRNLCRRLSLS